VRKGADQTLPQATQGHGGPVNSFLSWSVWAPLSRLTYCCYLIHMDVITMFNVTVLSSYPNDVSISIDLLRF
jgi:peptidoglycan/LPS O-acetylase OafA/YrhL